jgi:geranylgeranylglycerol-phosphate geranylgeranyltransferase
MRQGRLHIMPLGFVCILAGVSSVSTLNIFLVVESFFLALVSAFVASAPNDYFDADMDSLNERKLLTGAYVSNKDLGKKVAVSSVFLAFFVSFFIGSFTGLCLFVITLLSILYSVPPFRFKGRAPLDSICNGLGAFFLFGMGVGLTGGGFSDIISGAYWFSLIAIGSHGIAAIPDMKQDREEGLRTLPILIGRRATITLTQISIILAVVFERFSGLTSAFLLSLAFGLTILWKDWDSLNFNRLILLGVVVFFIYFTTYVYTRGVLSIRI